MRVNFIPLRVPVFTKVDCCCTSQSWAFALSRVHADFLWGTWVNLFFFLDGFSLHMFLWDVSPCHGDDFCFFWIVTFKWFWLLLTLLPASPEGDSFAYHGTSGKKVVLHWACLEFLQDSLQIACDETLKLFCYGDFLKNLPLGSPWSFTMIQENIDEMRFRKHR